jgi:glutamate racemase
MAVECPLFVPLVEEGLMGHAMTGLACAEYLTPLREARVGTLILGCTHYPLLKDDIGRFMGDHTLLVDSADVLAEAAAGLLDRLALLNGGGGSGRLDFHLSDIPWKFAEIGARFLGREITDVRSVSLDEMEAAGRAALEAADRKETT